MSFLLVYAVLSGRGFPLAFVGGLLVWVGLSTMTAYLDLRNLFFSVGVFLSVASVHFYLFKVKMKLPHVAGAKIVHSSAEVAFRALMGGGIVALAVLSSQLGGPELGGIASSFPAILSLTLFFHIPDPWDGAVASIDETVVDICGTNRFSLQSSRGILLSYFGVWLGTVVALSCSVPLVVLAHFLINIRKI